MRTEIVQIGSLTLESGVVLDLSPSQNMFPAVTIRDIVPAPRKVLSVLGIGRLHTVLRGPLVGMRVF